MRGKCQGFVLYRQTWQCNENIRLWGEKGRGFTNWIPPQCGAFSRDLQDKSQSPRYSPGVGGPWLQMTSALNVVSLHRLNGNDPWDVTKMFYIVTF